MLLCDNLYGKSYKGTKLLGSMEVADLLLTHKNVAITPGVCFGDDDAVRLSYALSTEDMLEGLERIAEFFRECE